MQQRDPGRTFVLGQRIQYVLLRGERLQVSPASTPLLSHVSRATATAWEMALVCCLPGRIPLLLLPCVSPVAAVLSSWQWQQPDRRRSNRRGLTISSML
jgi:hypothetical protein